MNKNKINLGFHVKKTSTMEPVKRFKTYTDAIKFYYEQNNINTFQIYTHVPYGGKKMKINEKELKDYITKNNIRLYSHSSHTSISFFKDKGLYILKSELETAKSIGAKGVVIHIAKYSPDHIVKMFKKYEKQLSSYGIPILVENSAYSNNKNKSTTGTYLYNSAENINELYSKLAKSFKKSYISGCIDTAHLFSAGVDPNTWEKINLSIIKLIHLNGSQKKFGVGSDKHSIPFDENDNIDKKYIINFAKYCRNIDMVVEPNRGKFSDLLLAINKIKN